MNDLGPIPGDYSVIEEAEDFLRLTDFGEVIEEIEEPGDEGHLIPVTYTGGESAGSLKAGVRVRVVIFSLLMGACLASFLLTRGVNGIH